MKRIVLVLGVAVAFTLLAPGAALPCSVSGPGPELAGLDKGNGIPFVNSSDLIIRLGLCCRGPDFQTGFSHPFSRRCCPQRNVRRRSHHPSGRVGRKTALADGAGALPTVRRRWHVLHVAISIEWTVPAVPETSRLPVISRNRRLSPLHRRVACHGARQRADSRRR